MVFFFPFRDRCRFTCSFPKSLRDYRYWSRLDARDLRAMTRISWKSRRNDDTCLLLKQNDFDKWTRCGIFANLTDFFFFLRHHCWSWRSFLTTHPYDLLASIFITNVGFSITISQSWLTIGGRDNLRKFRSSGPQDCNGLIWSAFSSNLFSFNLD